MRKTLYIFLLIITFLVSSGVGNAQSDKKLLREGNRSYEKGKYPDSEISYRKAYDKNKESADAVFNVGDALYKQNKFEEAGKQFMDNINLNEDRSKKSAALYNLGNSLLKANKAQESIEAYKESLKLKPDNNEAKYNLAYAQDLLQQQQQQQQDKDKKDQDKDNKDGKDKQKNENGDQDNKDSKQEQQQKEQQQQEISKEDAGRLLNAIANDEREVQEKVKLEKAEKARVRTVKNW